MLSLMEKLKDLKAGLEKETGGFNFRSERQRDRMLEEMKGKAELVTANALGAPVAQLGIDKGKRKVVRQS
ncbi:UNVERIFIED_CONTAM: hypothetical protein Sindi_0060200 [Sesamum indicum]